MIFAIISIVLSIISFGMAMYNLGYKNGTSNK